MAAAPDVKKHLEAIVGQSLSEDDLARIKLFQDVATSAITGTLRSRRGASSSRGPTNAGRSGCSTWVVLRRPGRTERVGFC